MGNVLKVIGKVGKGFATIAGAILGLGGLVGGGGDQVAKCVETLLSQPDTGAVVAGVVIVLFGIGRKAGWIASQK